MLLNKPIPLRYIFNKIKYDLLFVFIISVAVYIYTLVVKKHIPPIPIALPIFLGTAISLLLSFKLSQSYDRWWEARKIWGNIVNDSRNLILLLKHYVKPGNETAIRSIALRQIGWCYSLSQSLRGLNPLYGMNQYMSVSNTRYIEKQTNKPLAILDLNSKEIADLQKEGKLELFYHVQIGQIQTQLCDSMGKAERIKNTIFPTTYRVFLHLFIYIFIIVLSVSLADLEGIYEIPLLLIISAPFFLLEKTATHLQDPFSNLPTDTSMTAISRTIEINILQLLNEKEVPSPVSDKDFFIL